MGILSDIRLNIQLSTEWEEIIGILFHILVSQQSNDEVAQSLTDVLGIELTDIVFKLVEKRKDLVSVFNENNMSELFNPTGQVGGSRSLKMNDNRMYGLKKEQSVGPQVLVQSFKEKQLLKELRREEKKSKKQRSKGNEMDDYENEARLMAKYVFLIFKIFLLECTFS